MMHPNDAVSDASGPGRAALGTVGLPAGLAPFIQDAERENETGNAYHIHLKPAAAHR